MYTSHLILRGVESVRSEGFRVYGAASAIVRKNFKKRHIKIYGVWG